LLRSAGGEGGSTSKEIWVTPATHEMTKKPAGGQEFNRGKRLTREKNKRKSSCSNAVQKNEEHSILSMGRDRGAINPSDSLYVFKYWKLLGKLLGKSHQVWGHAGRRKTILHEIQDAGGVVRNCPYILIEKKRKKDSFASDERGMFEKSVRVPRRSKYRGRLRENAPKEENLFSRCVATEKHCIKFIQNAWVVQSGGKSTDEKSTM